MYLAIGMISVTIVMYTKCQPNVAAYSKYKFLNQSE